MSLALPERSAGAHLRELGVVFGITVVAPFVTGIAYTGSTIDLGQRRLLATVVQELIVVAVLWPWLWRRGWPLPRIAGAPEPADVGRGVSVALLAYVAYYISAIVWSVFLPASMAAARAMVVTGRASTWVVLLVSIVNPIVEEFLWLAYGVTALERYGKRVALVVSVALRTAVHSYQGVLALISVVPIGLVFTGYYAHTRRLWAIIVAHLIFDTVGLLTVVQR